MAFSHTDDSEDPTVNRNVNIFRADSTYAVVIGNALPGSAFTFVAQPAPEPESLARLGAGLAGRGCSRRRRKV